MNPWVAAGTTFLASALEFVEAATIVLAVGYTVGWRAALSGAAWACAVLVVIAALLGPALIYYVPLTAVQIVIGLFLILFGYTWLRKAIWRYAGRKAMRNEQSAYEAEVAQLHAHHDEQRFGFATSFNGVLLEGLEVAVIVITFSADRGGSFVYAAAGAIAAGLVVLAAAVILRHPFSRVPENAMGFIVGIMLLSFGTFWSGEGLGLQWWAGEATLLWIVTVYALVSFALIALWRKRLAA
jgi:Ca2+/H+ antiporter, TMEM165/GDT1 family